MKTNQVAACALACLSAAHVSASGLYCANVEVQLDPGTALRVECEGALYLDRLGVLRADELIELRSTGDMTLWGTLVAPTIVLVSDTNISLGGGLFSGSPEAFPEVLARSWANTPFAYERGFDDLVARTFIDPVYGASTFTMVYVELPESTIPITIYESIQLIPDMTSPVPEPAMPALLATGLALLTWRVRRAG
jgi:hypothetical protein